MNKLSILIVILFFAITGLHAQSCNPFFSYGEGTLVEHTYYNAKGKTNSSQKMTIKSVSNTATGQIMVADMALVDKQEGEIMTNEVELICENGIFKMDLSRFMPPNAKTEGIGDISIEFEGDNLELPSSLSVGSTLKDANFVISMKSDNPALSAVMGGDTETSVFNRKVVGKETLSTPAGSFECYKISYDTKVVTKILGMKKEFNTSSIEWISEGTGLVKVENYNKKGKLDGYMELTTLQNPVK